MNSGFFISKFKKGRSARYSSNLISNIKSRKAGMCMPLFSFILYSRSLLLYFIVVCLVKIAWRDASTQKISDRSVLILGMLSIVKIILYAEPPGKGVAGFFAVSLPMLILCVYVKGAFGGGDVKLMAAGGILFGTYGIWKVFCMGVLLSGGYVLCLLLCRKANVKTKIAMGPFFCVAMVMSLNLFF